MRVYDKWVLEPLGLGLRVQGLDLQNSRRYALKVSEVEALSEFTVTYSFFGALNPKP